MMRCGRFWFVFLVALGVASPGLIRPARVLVPRAVAFACVPNSLPTEPDGTIFVADGYGKNWIHKFDRDRKYVKSFGGPGGTPAEDGKFNRCHGLAVDKRGPKPLLIVCNRESGRVEQWDTDGNLVKVLLRGLRMPAAAAVYRDYIAVAELKGRVTILGKDNTIAAQLGDNPNEKQQANFDLDPA